MVVGHTFCCERSTGGKVLQQEALCGRKRIAVGSVLRQEMDVDIDGRINSLDAT